MKTEIQVKDGVIKGLERRVELFKTNCKSMRAVLRVPRLAREFHDLMAEGRLSEFDCLTDVYERHYRALGESLVPDAEKGRRVP